MARMACSASPAPLSRRGVEPEGCHIRVGRDRPRHVAGVPPLRSTALSAPGRRPLLRPRQLALRRPSHPHRTARESAGPLRIHLREVFPVAPRTRGQRARRYHRHRRFSGHLLTSLVSGNSAFAESDSQLTKLPRVGFIFAAYRRPGHDGHGQWRIAYGQIDSGECAMAHMPRREQPGW